LADEVMHCTVDELSRKLSITEYYEWGVYLDYKETKKEEALEKEQRKSGRGKRGKNVPNTPKRRR